VHPSQDSGAGCGRQWETGEDLNLPRLEPACRLRHGAGGGIARGALIRMSPCSPIRASRRCRTASRGLHSPPLLLRAVMESEVGDRRSVLRRRKVAKIFAHYFSARTDGSVGPAPGTMWPLQAPGAAAARTRMRVAPAVLRPAPARSAVRFDLRTAPAARPPIPACSRCAPGGRIQLQKDRVRAPGMMSQVRQNFRQIAPEDIPGAARCASGRFGHVPRGARRLPGRVLDVPKASCRFIRRLP
jgi:hypothetical protein